MCSKENFFFSLFQAEKFSVDMHQPQGSQPAFKIQSDVVQVYEALLPSETLKVQLL